MSHEKVKAITIKKNGDIYINSSCSNDTEPYKTWQYNGDKIDLICDIINGNLHLNNSMHKWNYIYSKIERYWINRNPGVLNWTISNEERKNILSSDVDFYKWFEELLKLKSNKNYIIKLERYKTMYITKITNKTFSYSYNKEDAKKFNMFEIETYKNKSNEFIVEEL